MKTKTLATCIAVAIASSFTAAEAASFQILSSNANVRSSGTPFDPRNESYSESATAPAGFSSFNVSLDVPGSAHQTTTIDLGSGLIESAGGASMSGAYSGSAASTFNLSFEVFEPTAYTVGGNAFNGVAGSGAMTFKRAGSTSDIFKAQTGRPPQSGVLGAGVYELRGVAFGNTPRAGGGGGSYNLSLQIGSGAGVPEATQSMCFLAGSVMFLFAGSRRRRNS